MQLRTRTQFNGLRVPGPYREQKGAVDETARSSALPRRLYGRGRIGRTGGLGRGDGSGASRLARQLSVQRPRSHDEACIRGGLSGERVPDPATGDDSGRKLVGSAVEDWAARVLRDD